MYSTRFIRTVGVFAAAALALSACARSGDQVDEPDQPRGQENPVQAGFFPQPEPAGVPVSGGTLTFADLSEVRSADPSQVIPSGASGGSAMLAIYDQLMRLNPETGQFEPRLAESVEPNEDYTEWTITLRPGVKFSDGTDVDAAAVVGSFEWYLESTGYDVAVIAPVWDRAEQIDDRTVKVTLTSPWATFPATLARALGFIVAPASIDSGTFGDPIGAGPFTYDSYQPGEELILKANPNYWDGAPHLDELRFVWLGADQTKFDALGSSVHAIYVNDPAIIDTIAVEDQPRFTMVSNNGQQIKINAASDRSGHNPKVRKAIAHAIDPQVIAERAAEGKGYYGKTLFAPISKWYDDSIEVNGYDVTAATRLLDEAKAEGFDGQLTITASDTPVNRETALTIKAQLDAAGFETHTDFIRNLADFISTMFAERNYEIAIFGHQVVDHDPFQDLYTAYASTAQSNLMSNNDPEMDELIEELRRTSIEDDAAMRDLVHRLEMHYQETVPSVTYRYMTPTLAWADNVHGIVPSSDMNIDFGKAWIQD